MSEAKQSPHGTRAQPGPDRPAGDAPSPTPTPTQAQAQVDALAAGFRQQLHLSLGVELPEETHGLAYVDHYLSQLRDETREPILALIAAGAGAWFGELIRREVGAIWVGDGSDPRRLRLLLEPAFLHFSPVDLAYEAIFSGPADDDDPRLPIGTELDSRFHLRKRPDTRGEAGAEAGAEAAEAQTDADAALSEHEWVIARLAEAAPMPEDQFHSLTGRFETLTLILELLASRNLGQGREPTRYHLNDYLAELAGQG